MKENETKTGTEPASKPKRKRKAGDYRYQSWNQAMSGVATWSDSEATFKGPTEALAAGEKDCPKGSIIRAIRIASKEFEIESETKTVLKPRA